MRMKGICKEDQITKEHLEVITVGLRNNYDLILEDSEGEEVYKVTKSPKDYKGQRQIKGLYELYKFSQELNKKFSILVIHSDGSFERYDITNR